jgi:hypothetical protein
MDINGALDALDLILQHSRYFIRLAGNQRDGYFFAALALCQ